ncbi:MAG: hypothetical protein PHH49_02855 [Candidatus Omnitrophica bacterium]|nr:hypothetical protein [Candidatus Omnitrophota bacterium]MDD5487889.1 hypothetical protein [Candidatus Omnitrophota bacterium]
MIKGRLLMVSFLVAGLISAGCASNVSEDKPIAEVKQEAKQMDAKQLQDMVTQYKKAIEAKKPELEKLQAKLKAIPIAEMMGKDAGAIKNEISALSSSIKALTDRMNAYMAELNKK